MTPQKKSLLANINALLLMPDKKFKKLQIKINKGRLSNDKNNIKQASTKNK